MTAAPSSSNHVAVDLGASSGRVMLGRVGPDLLELEELHRVPNRPVRLPSGLHWDVLSLYGGVLDGLRRAGQVTDRVDSIGIDSWAVDYGLLDADGVLLGNPYAYRDSRTEGVMERVLAEVTAEEVYGTTGVQFLPFNTAYQLVAARGTAQLAAAETMLLLPDLFGYWLTGERVAEATNASTTQLYDVTAGTWSLPLVERLGLAPGLFPPIVRPGATVGPLRPDVRREALLDGAVSVVAVGSHDTASAVVGVPAEGDRFGYVSCGTWSLVGVELPAPVLTEESRAANFTNEGGVDGTTRYLRNVMGLWLLQECVRAWETAGPGVDLPALLRAAAAEPAFAAIVDVDDAVFLPPGDMPTRIAAACRATGQPVPSTPAAMARCILDSLALAYRRTLQDAQRLSGRSLDVVHVVGGGSRNELLCQLTADACGLPVEAGPVEAAALGNVLVQARTSGTAGGGLAALRRLLRGTQQVRRYEPRGHATAWQAAERRLRGAG